MQKAGESSSINIITVSSALDNIVDSSQNMKIPQFDQTTESTQHICKMCKANFPDSEQLESHYIFNHKDCYKCKQCNKSFTDVNELKSHCVTHIMFQNVICSQCKKVFNNLQDLQLHFHISNRGVPCKCKFCNTDFELATFKLHKHFPEDNALFICAVCNMGFKDFSIYKLHSSLHSKVFKAYFCNVCYNEYGSRDDLEAHVNSHSADIVCGCIACEQHFCSYDDLVMHCLIHDRIKEISFKCNGCSETFSRIENLKLHRLKEKTFECHLCNTSFLNLEELVVHSHPKSMQMYICEICYVGFDDEVALESHTLIHKRCQSYTCHLCSTSYCDIKELEMHANFKHSKLYECNTCVMAFDSAELLDIHFESHLSIEQFECNYCGLVFSDTTKLVAHCAQHFKTTSLTCPFCCEQFMFEEEHYLHYRTHLNGCNTNDCESNKSETLDDLKIHYKLCKQTFRCETCGKTFKYIGNFQQHGYKHAEERLLICEICDESFQDPRSFTKHFRTAHKHISKKHVLDSIEKSYKKLCTLKNPKTSTVRELAVKKQQKEKLLDNELAENNMDSDNTSDCSDLDLESSTQNFKNSKNASKKKYSCEKCGKFFDFEETLKIHFSNHNKTTNLFSCKKCKRCYLFKEDLDTHYIDFHGHSSA